MNRAGSVALRGYEIGPEETLFGKRLYPFCIRLRIGYLPKLKIQQISSLKRK